MFENHCGIHHNSLMTRDPAYRARYEAFANQARQEEQQEDAQAEARRIAQVAQAEAHRVQIAAQTRANAVAKNIKSIADAHLASPNKIMTYVKDLMILWTASQVPTYAFPTAYGLLKFRSSTHPGFPELMRAVVRIVRQGFGRHPDHKDYMDVPAEERANAIQILNNSMTIYGQVNLDVLIPANDPMKTAIRRRIAMEDNQRREAERARQQAQLQHDLQHNPVVFQRDPEGGINLAAFATDEQSVHRSSIQNATHRALLALMDRPLADGQDTLSEIVADFQNNRIVRFSNDAVKERVITELTNDYFNSEAFSIRYGDAVDHVWTYIRNHVHRPDLVLRLAQEVAEGRRMCSNGKMARLINTLQGYDETLEFEAPKELFQNRIALVSSRPLEERRALADALFQEFNIPASEREAWLEPLLEA